MRSVLGFDGGGTKTECVLMNDSANILARTRSGPSNPYRVGIPASFAALQEAAQRAMAEAHVQPSSVAGLSAGLAGAGWPELAAKMRAALAAGFPGALVQVCTDLDLTLAAAGDGPAIVLIAGTGSAAIGRNAQGRVARAGGYGPQLGDAGSAYDIGRRAILRALGERDRTGEDSAIGKLLLRQTGCTDWPEVQERARHCADEVFPQAFPVVAAAADAGDEAARALLRDAAGDLARLVASLAERLSLCNTAFLLAKSGGTVGRSAYFDAQVDQCLGEIAPSAQIGLLPISLAEAAAHLALKLISRGEAAES